jgi:hypothetical protein
MKQGPFPHRRLCCPDGSSGTTGPSATLPAEQRLRGSTAYTRPSLPGRTSADPGPGRASPVPALTLRPFRSLYPEGFVAAALQDLRGVHGLRPEFPGSAPPYPANGLASRGGRIHLTLRTGRLLPPTGLSTLGFDVGRFPPTPPVCYPAPWCLPGPDFHRQAGASLCSDQVNVNAPPPNSGHTNQSSSRHRRTRRAPSPLHRGNSTSVREPTLGPRHPPPSCCTSSPHRRCSRPCRLKLRSSGWR